MFFLWVFVCFAFIAHTNQIPSVQLARSCSPLLGSPFRAALACKASQGNPGPSRQSLSTRPCVHPPLIQSQSWTGLAIQPNQPMPRSTPNPCRAFLERRRSLIQIPSPSSTLRTSSSLTLRSRRSASSAARLRTLRLTQRFQRIRRGPSLPGNRAVKVR